MTALIAPWFVSLTVGASGGQGTMVGGELPKRVTNSLRMDLVLVPAGELSMGSSPEEVSRILDLHPTRDREWFLDERPAHRVRISRPFYVGVHEVTNAQFRRYAPKHDSKSFTGQDLDGDSQPAVLVSWQDARGFCQWLAKREGRPYDLPTEAEWEYACRAGTGEAFYWGEDVLPDRLNYADRNTAFSGRDQEGDDGHAASAPVGSYPSNPFGIHDMLGNVWEWCLDWYGRDYYRQSPAVDPRGPASGHMRVCRGGAWNVFPPDARCAKRGAFIPADGCIWVGFRVVLRVGKGEGATRCPRSSPHNGSHSSIP